jgi:hypothetical protein
MTVALALASLLGLARSRTGRGAEAPLAPAPATAATPAGPAIAPAAAPATPSLPVTAAARPAAGPAARPRVDLQAALTPDHRRIAGRVVIAIPNPSATTLHEARLWLYPNHLSHRPAALGDVNFHWLYPAGFSPARIELTAARVEGRPVPVSLSASPAGPDTVAVLPLPTPVPPGGEARVELEFTTTIPDRLGNFGWHGTQCRLMGGFYPSAMHVGARGFDASAPPDRIDVVATISSSPDQELFVDGVRRPPATSTLHVESQNVSYLSLVADGPLAVDAVSEAGFGARYFHHGRRPPSSANEVLPYVREDRVGLVLQAMKTAFAFLDGEGLSAGAAPAGPDGRQPRPVVLIEAPLRHELVRAHGDVLLVSDRLFEIFPLDSLRKFHRLELVRALFMAVMEERMTRLEPDADVIPAAQMLAAYLTDRLTVQTFRKLEFARELLRPLAFIPAVDQLMYAPLVASSSSYFGDLGAGDPLGDDLLQIAHRRAGGRLLYSKLEDLIGSVGMSRVARLMLHESVPMRTAAAREFGADLDWFWRQWLDGPEPRVNYRLASVRAADPTSGQFIIDVERQGAEVREPVEVRVIDRSGGRRELVWNEPGRSHRFVVDLPAGLASVELDPRHRLLETPTGALDAEDDPLSDNRVPRRWRLIYSGFGALVDVTALTASLAAAVLLKPQHDLRNEFLFLVEHSPAVEGGLQASYERRFGRQADANRLASALGLGLGAARIDPGFGVASGESMQPGWRLSGSLFLEHDDRDYKIDPWKAFGVQAAIGYALTALDDGERLWQWTAGLETLRLFELAPGHVLALDLETSATSGALRRRSQLLRLGGSPGLRGYGLDELLGRGRVLGRLELRDRYVSDLDWNLGHFTSVRGLAGNLFVEAGVVTSCASLSAGGGDVFYDVGYSFRVLHDAFGVYQQMLSIDLAIPLDRRDRVCLGQHSWDVTDGTTTRIRRPPFVILVSFLPAF